MNSFGLPNHLPSPECMEGRKRIKALTRRCDFLTQREYVSSYDRAEITALKWIIEVAQEQSKIITAMNEAKQ